MMAQYRTHAKFNLLIALPLLLFAAYYFLSPKTELLLTFGAAFTYSTLFMNPDLDLTHQIRITSIRGILSLPFRLYSRVFKHRGLSHHIIFGSLTRILWLAMCAALVLLILYQTLPDRGTLLKFYSRHEAFILYGLAGVCFADWGHLLLDIKKGK